jgi:hypothetical protein
MILFQTEIEEHRKLADHYQELAAKREALAAGLLTVQQQADSDLSSLKLLLSKCKEVAPSAIASLKSAVLSLFSDDDDGNDGGNEPQPPAPEPDDSEFELFCLNGETGDCLTSDDLTEAGDEVGGGSSPINVDETKYPETLNAGDSEALLRSADRFWFGSWDNTGTVIKALLSDEYLCQIDGAVGEVELSRSSLHFILKILEGQACDIDAAPRTGQCCQWASPFASPFACPVEFAKSEPVKRPNRVQPAFGTASGRVDDSEPEKPAFTEFVEVSVSVGYLKIQHSGEIKAVYAGFSQKQRAESWGKWLAVRHSIASGFEVRAAKHLPFKWELKLWGLNINQINRLASENLAASPHTEVDSAKPPSYKKPQHPQPVSAETVKPGDIVAPLLSPENTYEVIQTMPNGILDCKSLKTGVNMGMRPAAVTLVSKSEQEAAIIQAGNLIEVKDPADGESRTGIVQEISRNPLAPIIVLFSDGSIEEFYRSQIKLLRGDISAQAHKSQGLKSGQILMGTAEKVAALSLVKSGMSRELALATATGTADSDYDF